MFARFSKSALASLCFVATGAYADFLPENNLHLQDGLRAATNVSEEQFNQIIDKAEAFYKPLIKADHGGSFTVNRRWTDSTVNASATQFLGGWQVNMYGGLARRPEVTPDGFALVLCHEIGHHLGGYPFSSSWAANEGAADYFATLSCARELWRNETKENAAAAKTVEELPKVACDQVWEQESDRLLCYRNMNASKSLATLLATLGGTKASFDTPDKAVVKTTYNAHPEGQCRLDTYAAGALCKLDFDRDVIPGKDLGSKRNSQDAEQASSRSTCLRVDFEVGTRPLCWFKPLL